MSDVSQSDNYTDTYDPGAGGVGYLTWAEFERFQNAVNNAQKHVGWWRIAGQLRAGDEDELRTRSADPIIPLPATWLAAEEITNLLHEINQWSTLEDVAKFGHEFALLITREVETAMHKWPMEDRPHKVKFLRCRACQQMTLKYYPPRLARTANRNTEAVQVNHPRTPAGRKAFTNVLPVVVKCTNCHATEDPLKFMIDAALIREEHEIAKRRRLGDSKRSTGKGGPRKVDGVLVGEGGEGAVVEAEQDSVAESA